MSDQLSSAHANEGTFGQVMVKFRGGFLTVLVADMHHLIVATVIAIATGEPAVVRFGAVDELVVGVLTVGTNRKKGGQSLA
jgi:hypothetical protein